MQLNRLELHHYRNYEELRMDTPGRVNIFIGLNAQGKTNLLESIYFLALSKSHRTSKDKELIRWESDTCRVGCSIEKKYGANTLDISLSAQGKKAKINGLEQKRLSDYVGTLNVVLFAPEDLELVKGSPGIRRRFLDMEISQVYPSYLHHLLQYQRVLSQRNNLLKSGRSDSKLETMLEIWNRQMAEYGVKIIKKRQEFMIKLQHWAKVIHAGITGDHENLQLIYRPSFDFKPEDNEAVVIDNFMVKLSQVKEQEMRRGVSLAGPHRDDISFSINGRDVQSFGSQGQQRTTALSVKLAEIELIREETGEFPVLLLDDVLSELDRLRQTQLIETFQNRVQTFITTTGVESVRLDAVPDAKLFEVRLGTVEPV